jgi:hypothetical protein
MTPHRVCGKRRLCELRRIQAHAAHRHPVAVRACFGAVVSRSGRGRRESVVIDIKESSIVTARSSLTVTPPLWSRLMTGGVYALIATVLLVFGLPAGSSFGVISIVVAVVVGIFVVRVLRAGVVLKEDQLVIRGFFSSRTIRRTAISSVERFPFVDWNDEKGISHQSIVAIFSGGTNDGGGPASRATAKRRVELWLQQGHNSK